MPQRIERLLSFALTVAAVIIAGVLVHREFFAKQRSSAAVTARKPPEFVPYWRQFLSDGIVIGDSGAPINIVEFMDFECPFCKSFDATTRTFRNRYGRQIAVTLVHFPLPNHRFAVPAARAAECAAAQGRFDAFVNAIYDKQDSLGLKSWTSYARDALVSDTTLFADCTREITPISRVERGLPLARKIEAQGTPTIIVNGWRFYSPPDSTELDRVITSILAGRAPFATHRS